jgi:hypothetical protein
MWGIQVQGGAVILLLGCVFATGVMAGIWLAVGWWALGEARRPEPVPMVNAEQLATAARAADWERLREEAQEPAQEPEHDGHTVVLRKGRGRHAATSVRRVRSEDIPAAQNDADPAPWDGAEPVRPH